MGRLSQAATRRLVVERANGYCEYCQTCEEMTGQAMHVEHIDPEGGNKPDNLCLACSNCNLSKATATRANDPESGEVASLFNPRLQNWNDHFVWLDGGLRVGGSTPIGRATVIRLKMNQERIIKARRRWIEAGVHPPTT